MQSGVSGIACATATRCVAVGGSDSVSVNGSNGATGTNHAITSEPVPIFYTVACPVATACYGGGTHDLFPGFETTLTPLSPDGVPGATTTGNAGQLESLACVTASRCYAAVSGNGADAVEVIDNGAAGKSFPLPFGGLAIACYKAASCEVAGSKNGTTSYAATVNPVTGKPGPAHAISGMSQAGGLACATSTECFVVGFHLRGSSTYTSAISDVENGTPKPATKVTGIGLSGVACSTATTCWAIGQNGKGGIVIAVPVP